MVIEDSFTRYGRRSEKPSARGEQHKPRLASPSDRLAAAVMDWFVILTPIILTLVAPFKRAMTESVLLDTQTQFTFAATVATVLGLILVWVYHTLSIYFFGATPGKMAFGLRVVDFWDHSRPSLGSCSLRSLMVVIEALLLGLPWLAALSDPRRRVLHDKIADTIVVAVRRPSVEAPGVGQVAFVRGVYAAAMGFVLLLVAVVTVELFRGMETQEKFVGWLGQQQPTADRCSEVSQAVAGDEDNLSAESRLQTAMELFAAGLIAQDCLRTEAEESLNGSAEASAMGYLAMAFAVADQPERSNEYLQQACATAPDSEACRMTDVVMNWSNEDWTQVAQLFNSFGSQASAYVQIWKLRYQMRQGKYEEALKLMEHLSGRSQIADYLVPERVKALWRISRHEEARLVAATAMETLDQIGRSGVSSWMCYEELTRQCASELPASCRELVNSSHRNEEIDMPAQGWLAMILMKEGCDGQAKPGDYEEIKTALGSGEIQDLVEGLELWSRGQEKLAKEKLGELVEDASNSDAVRAESLRRIVHWTTKDEELNPWIKKWQGLKISSRHALGPMLYRALVERGELKQAVEVAKEILVDSPEELDLSRSVAVTAYRIGDYETAWRVVQRLEASSAAAEGRSPASLDSYEGIVRDLKRRFSGK